MREPQRVWKLTQRGNPVVSGVRAKNSSRIGAERALQKLSRRATYKQHSGEARSHLNTGGGFRRIRVRRTPCMVPMHNMELGWSGSGWMDPMPLANEPPPPPPPTPPAPAPATTPSSPSASVAPRRAAPAKKKATKAKAARKPARKAKKAAARKPARKAARKGAKKSAKKAARKSARRPARKAKKSSKKTRRRR